MTESNGEAILSNNPTPHIYTRQSIGSKLKAHHLTHADQSSVRRRWSIWPRRTGGAKSYTQSSENAKKYDAFRRLYTRVDGMQRESYDYSKKGPCQDAVGSRTCPELDPPRPSRIQAKTFDSCLGVPASPQSAKSV